VCGVVGLVSRSADSAYESRLVDKAITCLAHRGPDGSGNKSYRLENSTSVYFGHTRLAIIDLSDEGLQPFESRDSRYSLTYNGEIYNYLEIRQELENLGVRFRSSSDTEVLLEALIHWSESALDKLEGMFAFAFLDKQANSLLLARDPFGIKPLHYVLTDGKFGFSSELRALRSMFPHLNKVERKISADFLAFGYSEMTASTFFAGVTSILPGHYLKVDLANGVQLDQPMKYWNPDFSRVTNIGFEEAKSTFRDLLLESVSLHMRSDVAVGAALSGGLDSSSIVSLMRHIHPDAEIHTFSYLASDPRVNEEIWVDKVTSWSKTIPHKVHLDEKVLFEKDLDSLIRAQSEPFSTLSIYAQFKVFELAQSAGIKVTLDGQGADELLAGYNGFPESRLLSLIEKGDLLGAAGLTRGWTRWPGRSLRSLLAVGFAEFFPSIRRSKTFIGAAQAVGLIGNHSLEYFTDDALDLAGSTDSNSSREARYRGRRLAEALLQALGPKRLTSLLRFADRNSMHSSIESRVPFLNRKLTEFTLSLPENYLLSPSGETKHILRRSLEGLVPEEILNRRDKIGFEASTKGWGLGSSVLREVANNLDEVPFIRANEAQRAILAVVDGDAEFDSNLWRVINFARWAQLEGVSPN
jgi:asparagine synthase (glutamine-hydrolysing)